MMHKFKYNEDHSIMEYYTATHGFDYGFESVMTSKDIANIIDELETSFPDGYKFVPEPISEGGIRFEDWPGKTQEMYKSFRFKNYNSCKGQWPWIDENPRDTLNKWREKEPQIIWEHPPKRIVLNCSSYLKAFHGAPVWTIEETEKFKTAFRNVGIKCQKPVVRNLKTAKRLT